MGQESVQLYLHFIRSHFTLNAIRYVNLWVTDKSERKNFRFVMIFCQYEKLTITIVFIRYYDKFLGNHMVIEVQLPYDRFAKLSHHSNIGMASLWQNCHTDL